MEVVVKQMRIPYTCISLKVECYFHVYYIFYSDATHWSLEL